LGVRVEDVLARSVEVHGLVIRYGLRTVQVFRHITAHAVIAPDEPNHIPGAISHRHHYAIAKRVDHRPAWGASRQTSIYQLVIRESLLFEPNDQLVR
jgi:hypothetical protein